MCVGEWNVSGIYPFCKCEFICEEIKQCPLSCDDGNPCTEDVCNQSTDFKCVHINLTGEVNGCSGRTDCLEFSCLNGTCVSQKIQNCCGNLICEEGEDNSTCPQDCPNCDDGLECTIDSFDYENQTCVHETDLECCSKVCSQLLTLEPYTCGEIKNMKKAIDYCNSGCPQCTISTQFGICNLCK